ncbi:hypothetical protein [Limnothrix redekei]|uniref:Uncharacterized protein n=1 Tax=Limnothrix redekei LRLZ20PSL1 TaxID=3112953 RepID=A0ABW7C6A5_9CYAN
MEPTGLINMLGQGALLWKSGPRSPIGQERCLSRRIDGCRMMNRRSRMANHESPISITNRRSRVANHESPISITNCRSPTHP